MAAKLLHSLADDNTDLQKQIGCMTGILQIFDRPQIGRGFNGQNHKRLLPPGNSQFSNASLDADSSNPYSRETMERITNKYTNDKRLSTESSRASFSSDSRSSSFSSLDCGRLGHPDPSSLDRIIFPDTPSSDAVITQPSPSPRTGRISLDLRDVVKDSMHRDSKGLPVQLNMKEDGVGQLSKHRDSPRPLHLSKSMDGSLGSTMNGKNDLPADLKESLSVVAKLRENPRYYSEKQHARLSHEMKDGSSLTIARDAPRYSYDGRAISRLSFEPRDFSKSNQRINDLPRLSLDSRESSMRSSSYDSNLAYLPTYLQKGDDSSNEDVLSMKQLSRPPSVVAKLMGLETLPDNKPYRDRHCGSTNSLEDCHHHSMPSKTFDLCRPIRLPVSPRSSKKDPTSPRWKNAEMRPISSSKCSNEPAPWRHLEGTRTSQQQATRRLKSPESSSKSSPSVISEIEKRLKDLEFKQSGKDLRALKQILEAMQAKGLLGIPKEETDLNMGGKREEEQSYTGPSMGYTNPNEPHKNHVGASAPRRSGSKAYESPIVIMKPAKLVQRSGIPASSLIPIDGLPNLGLQGGDNTRHRKLDAVNRRPSKDQSFKESQRENTAKISIERKANNRSLREVQNSTRVQRVSNDSSSKNLGSTSPRLQKKLEFDKRSRPPTPPDSGKSRRQFNRSTEAGGSPGGSRRRPKSNILQQNADQLSEVSCETRNISSMRDDISEQSGGVATLEPMRDVEVTSNKRSVDVVECEILSLESLKYPDASEIKTNSSTRSSCNSLVEELHPIAPEHPSPISVLDDSAYRENSSPPLKQTSHDLEGIGNKIIEQDNGEGQCSPSVQLAANHDDGSSTEINRNKLQSIEKLIQKLRRLNSNHDEARTDYIASLCENSNPDHRYVSEILLASGLLLRDLSSGLGNFQLHQSGYPINPELFLVLEQTKWSNLICKIECNPDEERLKLSKEKFHRKLIFDAVNEIVSRKLAALGQVVEPWLKPSKLAQKTLNAQKLLAELCGEIEELSGSERQEMSVEEEEDDSLKTVLWADIMNRSESWTDFRGDISGIVLDVERSIFKELVDEVVIGEATSGKPSSRRRRQLFSK